MCVCTTPPSILSLTDMVTTLTELHQAHAHMLKTGLIRANFAAGRIIAFASANPSDPLALAHAHSVFTRIPEPNSYAYNSLIRAYAESSTPDTSLFLFHQMLHGPLLPDKFTYTFILKACSRLHAVEAAQQIHARVRISGVDSDVFVRNTLIGLYANCGRFAHARKLFDRMPERDVISWNALIRGYVSHGLMDHAWKLFDEMPERNTETWNFVISGYVDIGSIEVAQSLFDEMPLKDVVSWNVMITGFARVNRFDDVLLLFDDMQKAMARPDNVTLVNVLSACGRVGTLKQGEWVHAYIDKNGIEINGFVATALVDMYSKCGNIEKALEVFSNASKKDISTWNSIIAGLSTHGYGSYALRLFSAMLTDGIAPNEITFISVLSACSHAGLLEEGRRVFDLMVQIHGIKPKVEHYGCMVDLLGRAGLLEEAEEFVMTMSLEEAPVVWESLLGACRSHGNVELAERAARQLMELSPKDSACYVQLSNIYASVGRWDDVREVRKKMRALGVSKEPGCSMIEVNGIVHEFSAGE